MIKFLHREMTVVWCMKKLTGLCSDGPRDCILSLCVKREQITLFMSCYLYSYWKETAYWLTYTLKANRSILRYIGGQVSALMYAPD